MDVILHGKSRIKMSEQKSNNIGEANPRDFIRDQIQIDLEAGKIKQLVTRFPPEPNGYLHIGHAKSICLNFGVAEEFNGRCNLRFDDTNPAKEEQKFIDTILEDIRWLGFSWSGEPKYASDNFEQLYHWAECLIKEEKAYVDDLSAEEIRSYRGTLVEPGKDSPYRNRSKEENVDLFRRMRAGEFAEGQRVLRAKINMASGNINLRDPVLYRISYARHPRTGDKWCVYPTYDFAHGQTDAIEGITHSLCTLEFEDHRPLYDWLITQLDFPMPPEQYEFSRLNIGYTVLSKRVLTRLVDESYVEGWDDPRMPTISGLRRRGVPADSVRSFIEKLSISKNEGVIEASMFEHCIRDSLNDTAPRRMAVLRPLKLTIENYPPGEFEEVDVKNNPRDENAGARKVIFGREIYIEKEDFMEEPSKKFFRLAPGREVRLRGAYYVTCEKVMKNEQGEVVELICSYDPNTRGGNSPDGRKVKGTLHWVSSPHAIKGEVRLYKPLFKDEIPKLTENLENVINKESLEVLSNCKLEPAIAETAIGEVIQFERVGYFCRDPISKGSQPIFNLTAGLRDTYARKSEKS